MSSRSQEKKWFKGSQFSFNYFVLTLKQFASRGTDVTRRKSRGKQLKTKKIMGLLPSLGNHKKTKLPF
jgi:hypothetical protein